jgi:hypothetical protein
MIRSNFLLAVKFLAVDSIVSFLYFPIWWYTKGAYRVAAHGFRSLMNAGHSFGVRIWLKNLFKPMFGQHDVTSRIISFFMRLVMIVYYSVVLLFLTAFYIFLFVAWLALPLFIVYEFFVQATGIINSANP